MYESGLFMEIAILNNVINNNYNSMDSSLNHQNY